VGDEEERHGGAVPLALEAQRAAVGDADGVGRDGERTAHEVSPCAVGAVPPDASTFRRRPRPDYPFDVDRKIVEFRLGTSDISAVRFGISPGYELVNAVRTLLRPQASPLQWGWLRTVQQRARTESFRLLAVVCGAEGYMPDFLTSTPSGDMTPEEELARRREVPDVRLRLDLHAVGDDADPRLRGAHRATRAADDLLPRPRRLRDLVPRRRGRARGARCAARPRPCPAGAGAAAAADD